MAESEEEATVGTLSVKLPTFWPDMPEEWFGQAEANFRARRITSNKSRFNHVVVALDSDTLKGVVDLIQQDPDDDSYDKLKARLVQAFRLSVVDKVKQAFDMPALTDESPVRLADKMMALTRGISGEDITKAMFLNKLPEDIRKVMWAEPLTDWTELKARANRLWHAGKGKRIAGGSVAEVTAAECQEANVVRAPQKGGRISKFRAYADKFVQKSGGPCVFHDFYGKLATKCKTPCCQAENFRAGRQ